jgi:hypothetical protein
MHIDTRALVHIDTRMLVHIDTRVLVHIDTRVLMHIETRSRAKRLPGEGSAQALVTFATGFRE